MSERIHVRAGDIIMAQGDRGHCAYVIEAGRIEVLLTAPDGEVQSIGTRGAGTMIGEMAIIDDAPRSATVRAVEDCALLEITREDFARRLEGADPILQMAMRTVLTRFRDLMQRARIRAEAAVHHPVESIELDQARRPAAVEALRIANDFGAALHGGEISLHYQPIVELTDGRIAGFESLMRWERPELGPLSPGIFIPVIEESGQIVEATDWALREALHAVRRIGGVERGCFVSVNVSSRDFAAPDFMAKLLGAVSDSRTPASALHLEITERMLMARPEEARETLARCRQAGMGISIDDFGTGYSSLSYLHAFPVDTLKIDRSFVKDMLVKPNAMELVRSIVALGKNLNLDLIAEGIETPEEAAALREMGCDMGQGYLFARPMPEAAAAAFARLHAGEDA